MRERQIDKFFEILKVELIEEQNKQFLKPRYDLALDGYGLFKLILYPFLFSLETRLFTIRLQKRLAILASLMADRFPTSG